MNRVEHRQIVDRVWDDYDAYLFDVDGTLLSCTDAVHYFSFCEALGAIAGRPLNLEGVTAHGNTDVGILRDALRLAQIPEDIWRPRLLETQRAMGRFVEQRTNDFAIEVLPGVRALLDHLHARGALLGIATGNLEQIGRLKLQHCGLLQYFDFAQYSDAYEHRRDVFGAAIQKTHTLAAVGAKARTCVVGDTPEDIRSAHANRVDIIAVATGIYPIDILLAEEPEWCVRSLEELFTGTLVRR